MIIEATGVGKRFGSRLAVDRIDIGIPAGQSVALFGPNGAGKTTLLRMLTCVLKPSTGTIMISGMSYRDEPLRIRNLIGFISHDSFLYDDLSAMENLVFFARLYGVPYPEESAEKMLEAMDLSERALDPVKTFSRGMTQRLSVARSLIHDPEIILLDEPFSGLDPRASTMLRTTMESLREKGGTLLMATHDIAQGLELSDRWVMMRRGRIVEEGRSAEQDARRLSAVHFTDDPASGQTGGRLS